MPKEMTEVLAFDSYVDPIKITVHEREFLTLEARFAIDLIAKWGMVAAEIDGEDSSGRSKIRRLTASEVVDHATETADRAMQKFRSLGWIKEMPSYAATLAEKKALDDSEEKTKPDRDGNKKRFFKIF